MADKERRTYSLQTDTIDWVEAFSDENDADKSEVVDRALRVYAAQIAKGNWTDPRFQDKAEKSFRRLDK